LDFSDHRDLALADAILEHHTLEEMLVDALQEAVAYRGLLSLALERWSADRDRLQGAQRRLLQVMGVDPWHGEEGEA
jgi:hypothetical protein